jgi:redox-sensing transcriptional repressor
MKLNIEAISKPTLGRMPAYLNFLYKKKNFGFRQISSTDIAGELNLNHVVVRKDMAATGVIGKPKTGFDIDELIKNITELLGYNNSSDAILVGVGNLGRTLLSYNGFTNYGVNIVAAFDINQDICSTEINGKKILHIDKLMDLVDRLQIHIGIITVPTQSAQEVCDLLIDSGILAIWNFAPVHLTIPDNILIKNENMAASLAMLSKHLKDYF